jgi:hypothetical protein
MSSEETALVPDDDKDEEVPNEEVDDVPVPKTGIAEGGGESGGGDAAASFCRLDLRWCCRAWLLLLLPLLLPLPSSSMALELRAAAVEEGMSKRRGRVLFAAARPKCDVLMLLRKQWWRRVVCLPVRLEGG